MGMGIILSWWRGDDEEDGVVIVLSTCRTMERSLPGRFACRSLQAPRIV